MGLRADRFLAELSNIERGLAHTFNIEAPSTRQLILDPFTSSFDEENESEETLPLLTTRDVLRQEIKKIPSTASRVPVVAVDAHARPIAVTNEGYAIYACKVAAVLQEGGELRCLPKMPAIYQYRLHPDADFIQEVYKHLLNQILGLNLSEAEGPASLGGLADRFRNAIEKSMQRALAAAFKDSILLFDGSLSMTTGLPRALIERIVEHAKANGNSVIAVSKRSRLYTRYGEKVEGTLGSARGPCCLLVHPYIHRQHRHNLCGTVYAVRFREPPICLAFRTDVASLTTELEGDLDALSKLISSASFSLSGYPEALAYAHAFASFGQYDVVNLRCDLLKRYDLRLPSEDSVRKSIPSLII